MRRDTHLRRRPQACALLVVCLALLACILAPGRALAKGDDEKIVKVGWFDSNYCYYDDFGRRCGMAYEYQHKVAAHTGWTYEYVSDSWPNLLQMLIDGEIDLLSDVSHTEDRAQRMLFSSLPMGQEEYYAFVDAGNREITADDLSTFNGKRIGVNKGSVQEGFLREWAKANGIEPEVVELTVDETEIVSMLASDELDAFVHMNIVAENGRCIPICQVGSSDIYFAVNKQRPDLLAELNSAMAAIQDEDPFYNARLASEYAYTVRTNTYLSPGLEDWLKDHGPIRVGYRDGILPFCAKDPATGEVDGALDDYLAHAASCLTNVELTFETLAYPTSEAALDALLAGEVDCVFPVNLCSHDCEQKGILETNDLMQTEMFAITRSDEHDVSTERVLNVALNKGNTNYDTFLKDCFPKWNVLTYPDTEACLKAVADGEVDCTLLSNYMLNNTTDLRDRLRLVAVPTGEVMGLSLATRRDVNELCAILDKTVNLTKSGDMDSSLAAHALASQKVTVAQFTRDNWVFVLAAIIAVFSVVLILLLQKMRSDRRAAERERQAEVERAERQRVEAEALRRELEQERQIKEARRAAFTDRLTGVKSKNAYLEAKQHMDKRIEDGSVTAFGVVVFDLNNLKEVNDTQGHEAGDCYIKDACRLVCERFAHSPVFRVGGDEFIVFLEGADYDAREELLAGFDALMDKNAREGGVVVSSGCACFEPGHDLDVSSVTKRADEAMYARKRALKAVSQ